MIRQVALLLIFSTVTFLSLFAQNRKELENKRKQLIEEINQTTVLLERTKKDKATALNRYLALQHQIQKRQQLIQTILSEITAADTGIAHANQAIVVLGADMERLKIDYAAMLRTAYRHKKSNSFLIFLFSAKTFNDAFRRWQYIRQYEKYRSKQVLLIQKTRQSLLEKATELKQQKRAKERLLAYQQQQQLKLNSELGEKDKIVQELKANENKFTAELNRQQKAHSQLNKAIEEIIRAEIAKKKKESRSPEALTASNSEKVEENATASGEFTQKKGKLPWPVSKGYITRHFGAQPHPTLNGIKISNNGIDIQAEQSAEVYAVHEGKVVGKQFVPGYQNMVIVQHGTYYTVYSNLEEVFVSRGDSVSGKQIIGKIGTDKPEVHFEVWHEKQRLNPVHWLKEQEKNNY